MCSRNGRTPPFSFILAFGESRRWQVAILLHLRWQLIKTKYKSPTYITYPPTEDSDDQNAEDRYISLSVATHLHICTLSGPPGFKKKKKKPARELFDFSNLILLRSGKKETLN